MDNYNQHAQKQNPDFMDFVCKQDAEIEEIRATPKRLGRPNTEWDKNPNLERKTR